MYRRNHFLFFSSNQINHNKRKSRAALTAAAEQKNLPQLTVIEPFSTGASPTTTPPRPTSMVHPDATTKPTITNEDVEYKRFTTTKPWRFHFISFTKFSMHLPKLNLLRHLVWSAILIFAHHSSSTTKPYHNYLPCFLRCNAYFSCTFYNPASKLAADAEIG